MSARAAWCGRPGASPPSPASGLAVADSPDFELYDGRFATDRPGTVIDVHVLVVA
ncbi:hypothetical protein SAMN04487843_10252 [Methylobacterium sp. ap11]|uniref:hypothetical protein n=1 Tax=Methylobacterium sp. ap11 TaxID=1761799 RepID=UPI0008C7309D|nr:hypothetical protein [Methylobacterium sp. ap11]SEO52620.1 hypothetical protein SAMN04487843_10252 [Methylobacterium sp. ap11]